MIGSRVIYGLIGYPVRHSFSPAMHNAAFAELGISAEYLLFEVKPQELKDFLLNNFFSFTTIHDIRGRSVPAGHIMGLNVTIPHKIAAKEILMMKWPLKHTDMLDARFYYLTMAGAINTIVKEADGVRYDNTDVLGFIRALEDDVSFDAQDKNIFVVGCGGAGRAIMAGLLSYSFRRDHNRFGVRAVDKIYVYDIDEKVAASTAEYFEQYKYSQGKVVVVSQERIADVLAGCQLLVNASHCGMYDDASSVIEKEWLHKNLSVFDVVYNRQTKLISDARLLGLPAVSGLSMLLYQGAAAFTMWTGQEPPLDVMRAALQKELGLETRSA